MERTSNWPERMEPGIYAALRILTGLMFAMHGMQKLFGWFGSPGQPPTGSLLWFGGLIELICGLLIAIGLFTRPAALLAAGEMAYVYFFVHWKLQTGGAQWSPLVNHGELSALYALLFLFILARGHGLASVDSVIWRRAEPSSERSVRVGPLAGDHP